MTMAVRGAGWSAPGANAAPMASAPTAAASEASPLANDVIRMSILRMTVRSVNLVTQRGRGARALLPAHDVLSAWLHVAHRLGRQHPRDQRRRGSASRRVAVHGLARLLRQGPRAGIGGHAGEGPPRGARARLPAQRRGTGAAPGELAGGRASRA